MKKWLRVGMIMFSVSVLAVAGICSVIPIPTDDPGSIPGGQDQYYRDVNAAFVATDSALSSLQAANSLSMSEATGTSVSLTTTATQTVKVDLTMEFAPGLLSQSISLNYDGVAKHTQTISLLSALSLKTSVTLQCVIAPGAQTKNLTVTSTGGTISNVKWTLVKAG